MFPGESCRPLSPVRTADGSPVKQKENELDESDMLVQILEKLTPLNDTDLDFIS